MRLEGRDIAVVGAGIGGLAAATRWRSAGRGCGSSSRRRRSARSAPASRSRRTGWRCSRRSGCATPPRPGRACRRPSSSSTTAAAGGGAGAARAGDRGAARAALLALPPRRPAGGARGRRGRGGRRAVARRAGGRASSPTATGLRARAPTAAAAASTWWSRRTGSGRRCGPRTSTPAPARFTGHVAWRGAGAGRAGAGGAAAPGGAGDDGAGAAPRHLSAARRRGSSTSSRSRSAPPGPRRAGRRRDDPANLRRAFAGWGGAAGALLDGGRGLLALGALRPRAARRLGRRPAGAARRRLPSDAAVPGAGRDDGARGRLGARRRASTSPRTRRAGSRPTRRRGCRGRRRVQRAAARSGRIYHLRPGPARAGAGGARRAPRRWRRALLARALRLALRRTT